MSSIKNNKKPIKKTEEPPEISSSDQIKYKDKQYNIDAIEANLMLFNKLDILYLNKYCR